MGLPVSMVCPHPQARTCISGYTSFDSNADSKKTKSDRLSTGRLLESSREPSGLQGENVVAWDGIEPSTRGFSIRCSTN